MHSTLLQAQGPRHFPFCHQLLIRLTVLTEVIHYYLELLHLQEVPSLLHLHKGFLLPDGFELQHGRKIVSGGGHQLLSQLRLQL